MQIITDDPTYLGLQQQLLQTLAGDVRDTLREAAEGSASLEDAVKAITVTVAMIIDGTREMAHDGKPVRPMVMFGVHAGDEAVTDVIANSEASSMHERAIAAAEAVLARPGTGTTD